MADSLKRKDSKGRILREGEQQRADGRYMFTFKDPVSGDRKYIYSWKLESRDKIPTGKKNDLSLREKEKLIEKDLRDGISYQAGNITVLELVERYISLKTKVRATTKAGYKTVINVLKKDPFGKKNISVIKTSEAKKWLIELQSGGRSYSSVKSIRGVVRPAFTMAVEDDLIRKNPFNFELADVLIDDSVKREALTAKQERAFLKFIKEDEYFSQFYDGIFILFKTGLRISEFCGLTIPDIDFQEETITVNKQLQYTSGKKAYIVDMTKTEAGMRVLPMSAEVSEAFRRVISSRKKPKIEYIIDGVSRFIFLDNRGKPMLPYQWEKKFNHSLEKHNKIYKAELPNITPHVCRHTYCSNQVKRGLGVKTVQYLMGHADVQTTLNIYTHIRLEDAKNDMERVELEEQLKKEMALVSMEDVKRALKEASNS